MKVYTKTYNVNYESLAHASPPLTVPVNKKTCFAIPFPSEGLLERLVVYQEDGSDTDFSVELLNSRLPFPPGDYADAATPTDNLENYRLQLPITGPIT
jgi:hypothetical protein